MRGRGQWGKVGVWFWFSTFSHKNTFLTVHVQNFHPCYSIFHISALVADVLISLPSSEYNPH